MLYDGSCSLRAVVGSEAVWERVGLSHEDSVDARLEGLGVDPDQCGLPDLDFQGFKAAWWSAIADVCRY